MHCHPMECAFDQNNHCALHCCLDWHDNKHLMGECSFLGLAIPSKRLSVATDEFFSLWFEHAVSSAEVLILHLLIHVAFSPFRCQSSSWQTRRLRWRWTSVSMWRLESRQQVSLKIMSRWGLLGMPWGEFLHYGESTHDMRFHQINRM